MNLFTLRLSALSLALCSSLAMAGETPFYRGGQDNNKATAPNGAVLNADYLSAITHLAQGVEVLNLRPGLHVIRGYHLVNTIVVDGKTGLIVIDTGTKTPETLAAWRQLGHGQDLRKIIRQFSDKPIKAIIYSHHHYMGGAGGLLDGEKPEDVQVFAHPQVEVLAATTSGLLGPMQLRRIGIQFGAYLPEQGEDAAVMPAEKTFSDPQLNASSPLKVTHAVKDGEDVDVDGVKIRFHQIIADSSDSLAIEFPELDAVVANSVVAPFSFPLYTLRGDYFRTPDELIAGADLLRSLDRTYFIPVHGAPYTDKASGQAAITAHRDAYAFIWNQSLRAINLGMTPDEMVASIHLPDYLRNNPTLFPAYVDWEYGIRGIYRGMVGWYSEDGSDLHPPAPAELGQSLVEGFGGAEPFIAQAHKAMAAKKYNLAAKLMSLLIAAEPDNQQAKQLKADALRAMAQGTRTGMQTRNFMLTEALNLEGKVDWKRISPKSMFGLPTVEALQRKPPQVQVKLLEIRLDPQAAGDLNKSVAFRFPNEGECGLLLRPGIVEYRNEAPKNADIELQLDSKALARLTLRQISLSDAVASGEIKVSGDKSLVGQLEKAFSLVPRKS